MERVFDEVSDVFSTGPEDSGEATTQGSGNDHHRRSKLMLPPLLARLVGTRGTEQLAQVQVSLGTNLAYTGTQQKLLETPGVTTSHKVANSCVTLESDISTQLQRPVHPKFSHFGQKTR